MCAKLALKLFLNLSVLRVIHGADLLSSLKDTVLVRQSHCLAAHFQLFSITHVVQRKCRIPSL